jgi:hypothetical protein
MGGSNMRAGQFSMGPLLPGSWKHIEAGAWSENPMSAAINRFSPPNIRRHVTFCIAQAVLFSDGQLKILYNPL